MAKVKDKDSESETVKAQNGENAGMQTGEVKNEQNIPKFKKTLRNREKFYRVRFHERTSNSEPENITLGVNGNILVIRRGVTVVIPECFVQTARRAVIKYRYEDINTKKIINRKIARCSFDILGEGTEAEFMKLKADGTRKTRKALEDEAAAEADTGNEE